MCQGWGLRRVQQMCREGPRGQRGLRCQTGSVKRAPQIHCSEEVVVGGINWSGVDPPHQPRLPSRPSSFIAISVLPSVRQTGCLSMRLIVLFPSPLDGARDMAFRF